MSCYAGRTNRGGAGILLPVGPSEWLPVGTQRLSPHCPHLKAGPSSGVLHDSLSYCLGTPGADAAVQGELVQGNTILQFRLCMYSAHVPVLIFMLLDWLQQKQHNVTLQQAVLKQ